MEKKTVFIYVFLIVSLLAICIATGLALSVLSSIKTAREAEGPVVEIYEPAYDAKVSIHDAQMVRAVARDAQGVQRVELWADDELVHTSTSQLPQGSSPFPLIVDWQPGNLGRHSLVIRAYNQQGQSGLAAVSVDALDIPKAGPEGAYEVREGDTLESLAEEYETSVEEIIEHNPGCEDGVNPGDSLLIPPDPDEEEPPDAETPVPMPESLPEEGPPELTLPIEPSLLQRLRLGRLFEPHPPSSRELQVEAISLEVDKDYDGVFCYYSLARSGMTRVPTAGELEGGAERSWDIAAELGGDNSRILSIPEDEDGLDVLVRCMGLNIADGWGTLYDLGVLGTRNPESDWDGHPLEYVISGPSGWFRLVYRITSPGGGEGGGDGDLSIEIVPPGNLKTSFWTTEGYGFNFDYPTSAMEGVAGFHLFRNGDLIRDVKTPFLDYHIPDSEDSRYFIPLSESDFFPTCPDTNEFHLTAYIEILGEQIDSDPSNTVSVEGDPTECYELKGVKVTFEQLHVWCVTVDDGAHDLPCHYAPAYDEDGNQIGCETNCNPDVTWGAPDGKIWINGEKVASMWGGVHSARIYGIPSTYLHIDPDEAYEILTLEPLDSLTITMKWWDYDVWSDPDRFCHGEHTITANELYQIRTSEYRQKSYNLEFNGGGGNCFLQFTVEVLWP